MIATDNYLTTAYTERWDDLIAFLDRWYGSVDRQALACVLAAVLNHYWLEDPPIWLLLQVPPSYALGPFLRYHDAIRCFGFPNSTFFHGMLHRSVPHAIWLFPEFERIYDCRPRIQKAFSTTLASMQHNEVTLADSKEWTGKVSILAAHSVKPNPRAIRWSQRFWEPLAGAFVVLRWQHPPEDQQLDFARRRVGFEQKIDDGARERVLSLLDMNFRRPQHADIVHDEIEELSKLAALASRCYQQRSPYFRRTLWTQSLARICRAHATLFGKLRTDPEEANLAKRIAQDSLPPTVLKLLRVFEPGAFCVPTEIEKLSDLPKTTLKPLINSLVKARILEHRTVTFQRPGVPVARSKALRLSPDLERLVGNEI